ncbi:hypothetical protein HNP86_001588 [Methanococcus maripaludis]|uniref:Uncharacterized protein n=1 Tax=Methanococcus maripaludis TaxID=39152 RepID=A0A7J9NVZ1_METMI|nr:hypothetical protein [Methanococcus maripaludis]MBA2851435.1 hypothetical protein [Methanococcus maripaludis]
MILKLSKRFKNVPKKENKTNFEKLDFSEESALKLRILRQNSCLKCL